MASHELITLQVGNYSNFVGAHWFNIQQNYLEPESEFDPVVLWREGISTSGGVRSSTWTPRVLIFDLKGGFCNQLNSGNVKNSTEGSKIDQQRLVEEAERNVLWHGPVQRIGDLENINSTASEDGILEKRMRANNQERLPVPIQRPTLKSDLEASSIISSKLEKVEIDRTIEGTQSKSWSDYTVWKLPFIDRVAFDIPNFSHNTSTEVISNYGQGLQIYSRMKDSIEDGVRFYAEDCDYFQGFQVLVDQNDGFSGLSKGILQHISDEFEKKCCVSIGLSPADSEIYKNEKSIEAKQRLSNTALCWSSFNHHSSVFTSLGLCDDICKPRPKPNKFPWINYNGNSSYESSAILAAALDTATASYRLKSPSFGFSEVIGLLNGYNHNMCVFGSAFPLSLQTQNISGTGLVLRTLFQTLSEDGLGRLLHSLTPGLSISSVIDSKKSIGNLFLPRGLSNEKVISEKEGKILQQQHGSASSSKITTVQSCLELYSQETCPKSVNVVRSVATPFKLSHPFPTLLVDQTFLQTQPKFRYQTQDYWKLPTMASAHNSMETGVLLGKLIEEVCPEKMRKSNFKLEQSNIEIDDYSECINDLRVLRDSYDNN